MATPATKRMTKAYYEKRSIILFFQTLFQSPAENFFKSEKVEWDIERDGEDVAVAVKDYSAGYNNNSYDEYTSKEITPPGYKESFDLNVFKMLDKQVGKGIYGDPNFQADATLKSFKNFRRIEKKIRRAVEIQCAQVLTTGTVDLKDKNGATIYTVDFKPKIAHFPTAGIAWTSSSAVIEENIMAVAQEIRNDSGYDADELIMDEDSYVAMSTNDKFMKKFNYLSADFGVLQTVPTARADKGATFHGRIKIGAYWFNIFTYDKTYKDPETGDTLKYIGSVGKCIVRSSAAEAVMNLMWGFVPNFRPIESRPLQFLPARMSSTARGLDLFPNAWMSNDGENFFAGLAARPVAVPTAIDSYGCIITGA